MHTRTAANGAATIKRRLATLVSYYRPYTKLFAADLAGACGAAAAGLTAPLIIRHIAGVVAALPPADAAPALLRDAVTLAAVILAGAACALVYDALGHDMGARMERDMRRDLFNHCLRLPFAFFDREPTGAVMSRISADLLNLAELCHHGPEDLFIYAGSFAAALVLLFRVNGRLALLLCLFLPAMAAYTLLLRGRLARAYRRSRETIAGVNARLEDSLSGVRTVKSYAAEDVEAAKFDRANGDYYRARTGVYRTEAWYYTVIGFLFVPLMTAVVAVAGLRLAPGDLVVFLLYAGYLTAPLPTLARVIAQYQDGFAALSRFTEIMAMPVEGGCEKVHRATAIPAAAPPAPRPALCAACGTGASASAAQNAAAHTARLLI